MRKTKLEMKVIYISIIALFIAFLVSPLLFLFIRSFQLDGEIGFANYVSIFSDKDILISFFNSIKVSFLTATITTILAFTLAYTVHYTNVNHRVKSFIRIGIVVPMLLPTITYGFAIIYSFGKQGLITKLLGTNLFEIYGFNGLLIGYTIYTLPAAFLLMNDGFKYIDKKFTVVSLLMGDHPLRRFKNTIIRPLIGTICGSFILSFVLSFTDFGIPASIGGTYQVVSTQLYQVMLGSIPDFNSGAAIAVFMLLPAVFSIGLLQYLEKFNFHYDKFSEIELVKNKGKDYALGTLSTLIVISMLSIFVVMFVAPFVENYPYKMEFTLKHVMNVFQSSELNTVYKNSLFVATVTAIVGTIVAYSAALLNARSTMSRSFKSSFDIVAMITNTVPGMVLGLSYLLLFNNSSLKGTFFIIIICNIVHFFTTPYLMAKNALSKMNKGWETTGQLMGDTWIKTVIRVIIPNSFSTVIEMMSYYFIHSMVTISGIIFLVTAQTALVSSKIKELQHFAKFNEIFVLSLIIFFTNLSVKVISDYIQSKK